MAEYTMEQVMREFDRIILQETDRNYPVENRKYSEKLADGFAMLSASENEDWYDEFQE